MEFQDYGEKVSNYRERTGLSDAVVTGRAKVMNHPVVLGVMDFRFLGASMGSVVGEKLTRAIEAATKEKSRGGDRFGLRGRAPCTRAS